MALHSRSQQPNETVAIFVEYMTRLFNRADHAVPEDNKERHVMRAVKEQLLLDFSATLPEP